MNFQVSDVMISREEIKDICQRLGQEISQDYAGEEILLIGVLNGAFVFLADLLREITVPCTVDFIKVSSYGSGTVSSGNVNIIQDTSTDISGKNVIIVEDIIDTGYTLNKLKPILLAREPKSLKLCAAFDKYERRKVDLSIDYCGRKIPDEFIVGYGLDYNGYYRNLPDIHYVSTDI